MTVLSSNFASKESLYNHRKCLCKFEYRVKSYLLNFEANEKLKKVQKCVNLDSKKIELSLFLSVKDYIIDVGIEY